MGSKNIETEVVRHRSWTAALLGGCAATAIFCGAPAFAQQIPQAERAEGERVVVVEHHVSHHHDAQRSARHVLPFPALY